MRVVEVQLQTDSMLIDDFADQGLVSTLGCRWRCVTDQVMGGISEGFLTHAEVDGRPCLHLAGEVRLDNNGGFVQAALDFLPNGETLDASGFAGLSITVRGNRERYSVHLRTPDAVRPWQSYRAHFVAEPEWTTFDLPFAVFVPYRLSTSLDSARLRRIGLVAIGRAFGADLAVSRLAFYR